MEDFYASLKLITGEELLAQVLHDEDDDVIIICNAVEIDEDFYNPSPGVTTYVFTPKMWMKYSGEDSFIIKKDSILTITELSPKATEFYRQCLERAKVAQSQIVSGNKINAEDQKGYVATVDEARMYFEHLYRSL